MRITIHAISILLFVTLSCSTTPAEELKIVTSDLTHTWRTISSTTIEDDFTYADPDGIITEWGHWYVQDFELLTDGSLDLKTNNYGNWQFDESSEKLFIFDEANTEIIHEFDVEFNAAGQLILTDNFLLLIHNRL